MPLIAGKGNVGPNIKEFRTGPSYQHTQDKFGKPRAEKQALAVALHEQDKGGSGGKTDHHAAVARMNPEHVHKLVQAAHAGQYGPQAQQTAQQAMQAPMSPSGPMQPGQSDQDGDEPGMPARNPGAMFSAQNDQDGDEAPMPPPSRASMFRGGR